MSRGLVSSGGENARRTCPCLDVGSGVRTNKYPDLWEIPRGEIYSHIFRRSLRGVDLPRSPEMFALNVEELRVQVSGADGGSW